MSEDANTRIFLDMYSRALDASIREWDQLAERFRDLDSKAQATATVSGVFIAAVFAFTPQLSPKAAWYVLALVGLSLLALVTSVVLCVIAMKIRKFRSPPGGTHALALVEDIRGAMGSGRHIDRMQIGFYIEQATQWQEGSSAIKILNSEKARMIGVAQWMVVGASCLVTAATMLAILP